LAALTPAFAQAPEAVFSLVPEKKVISCLSANDGYDPSARVIVQRGELNDVLVPHAKHLKPNTAFDLFTVQNSNLLADGSVDPNFKNFGLAWYQTDLQSNEAWGGECNHQDHPARPDLRIRSDCGPATDQHVPCWILVQQSAGCRGLRL
jgi:hypothetical protein